MTQRIETGLYVFPQTFLGRMAAGLLAAALLVSAFFFLYVFLLVAGVLILGISLRLLWRVRQIRAKASQDVLEGEYSVEPHEVKNLDDSAVDITHKR